MSHCYQFVDAYPIIRVIPELIEHIGMFTGIIQAVGEIKQIRSIQGYSDNGLSLEITAEEMDLSDVMTGDSIAVNGVCLTVTNVNRQSVHGRCFAGNAQLHTGSGSGRHAR